MGLFLSTAVNKIDRKGRVSIPSHFRAALSGQSFQGVVLFPSHHYACLEGFGWDYIEEISQRLDTMDFFSNEQDDLATTIFGESVQLSFDNEGRILLPQGLREHAALDGDAVFVGLGRKFQVWEPAAFEQRKAESRQGIKSKALTLPKGGVV
ncbi:MAG: division/cell wall cluster transcriptional repressor MraZ [Rhodospirillales bacterium]|nr:division/cell wall cluster transcriptional repressor MraZ [Rhodospirillales bacterium]MCB9979716.1 division/cell wall cluster transcriptional repressor MraZ [Rhodospirillales bacterium]